MTVAIRPRQERSIAGLDLRDGGVSTAIGDALKSRSNSWKYRKQHGFYGSLRSRSDCGAGETTLSCRADTQQNLRNKAEKRWYPHAPFPPTESISFCWNRAKVPLVVLCHGRPELSYSWRHQIEVLAAAGFHVAAPDMRGFGRTSAPADINAYSIFDHVGDMVALVAALGEKRAIIVGHDWGAPVAWHSALFRPDVFSAVAGMSFPALPWPRPAARYLARKRHHQFLLTALSDGRCRRTRVRA
jgi:pimeloyl-ACP methyl ester carboxylesterase